MLEGQKSKVRVLGDSRLSEGSFSCAKKMHPCSISHGGSKASPLEVSLNFPYLAMCATITIMMTNGGCHPGDNKDEVIPTQGPPSHHGSCITSVISNGLLLYTRKLSAVLGIWLILVQDKEIPLP